LLITPLLGYLTVNVKGRGTGRRPRELTRSTESFVTQAILPCRFDNCSRDRRRVFRVGEYGGSACGFWHHTGI